MNAPLVSIVLPFWNRRDVLPDALRSIQQQTYRNWELVAIDDGSTDDSAGIVRTFARDKRIRCHRLAENRGVAAARNVGVQQACGEYVAFIDSDDIWFPQKLQEQVSALKTLRAPASTVIYTQIEYATRGQATRRVSIDWLSGNIHRNCLAGWSPAITPSIMLHRDLFLSKGGFDEHLAVHEDEDLWMKLARDHEFFCIPSILVRVRTHAVNRLSWNPDVRIQGLRSFLDKWHKERVKGLGERAAGRYEHDRIAKAYAHLAVMQGTQGDRLSALTQLWLGLRVGHIPARLMAAAVAAVLLGHLYDEILSRKHRACAKTGEHREGLTP